MTRGKIGGAGSLRGDRENHMRLMLVLTTAGLLAGSLSAAQAAGAASSTKITRPSVAAIHR